MNLKAILFSFLVTFYFIGPVSAQKKIKSNQQIPVLGWHSIPANEATVERYVEMRNAGFTLSFPPSSSVVDVEMQLDIAQKVGMKLIIACPELQSDTENTVRRFMNHPALAGYHLKDEPTRNDFPALTEWAKKINAIDNKHFCYINLLPNYASPEQLGTKTYRDYVQTFLDEVPVPFLSFDHYPIQINKDGIRTVNSNWYENLEIISDEASRNRIPFWAFALTTSHWGYPVPTLEDLRLQVYSNLAYGAQVIQDFTYWTPWEPFKDGPIALDCTRSIVYERAKTINEEIKKLSGVFLGAKVVSIAHTGNSIPAGTRHLGELPSPIKSLETKGEGAIVSLMEKDKNRFLVIVNRDIQKSMQLNIQGNSKIKRVLKDGSLVPGNIAALSSFEVTPGDVAIFTWKKTVH